MYQHTQAGTVIRWAVLLGAIVPLAIIVLQPSGRVPGGARVAMLLTAVLLLGTSVVFGSLTIRVGDGLLTWTFGPGVLRKSVPLASIAEIERTQTTMLEGWGIHLTRRGWLYNVSGQDAVWFRLVSGKQLLLGTDEPERLIAAVRAAQNASRV